MRRWGMMGLVLGVVGLMSVSVAAQDDASGTQQAKLNELIVEYTQLYQLQHYDEAIDVAQEALGEAERTLDAQDVQVAQILNDLGYFHQSQGHYAKAEPLHSRALAIRDRAFHSDGPAVVQSLNNLAKCYRAHGRYAEAVSMLKRSVAILERDVPPNHPSLHSALELYAVSLRESGNNEEASAIEARLNTMAIPASANPQGDTTRGIPGTQDGMQGK